MPFSGTNSFSSPAVSSFPASISSPNPVKSNSTPFEDFLPAWMQPPQPVKPSGAVQPGLPHNDEFSIEELLRATESAPPAPSAPPAVPGPGANNGAYTAASSAQPATGNHFSAGTATGALSVDDLFNYKVSQTVGTEPAPAVAESGNLPLPSFQEPPLWGKAASSSKTWSFKEESGYNHTTPFQSPSPGESTSAYPPAAEKPLSGVDRGVYYFTDDVGDVNVFALAGFVRRAIGAVVDAILLGILSLILYSVMGPILIGSLLRKATEDYYRTGNEDSVVTSFADGLLLTALGMGVFLFIVSFLYPTLLVGLGGQTLGHRFMKIKVVRRGGRGVGLLSGAVRTLYGVVPNFVQLVLLFVFGTTGGWISLLISLLVMLGFLLPLVDKNRQGLHDKLADTYVVSTTPL
ncbi:MAG TPA: RDD family protein [Chloroflexia bacterium]|nr:RDD family protein [Chloroflexia bacterium]